MGILDQYKGKTLTGFDPYQSDNPKVQMGAAIGSGLLGGAAPSVTDPGLLGAYNKAEIGGLLASVLPPDAIASLAVKAGAALKGGALLGGMTKPVANALDYGIAHRPPMKGTGAPLHDLTVTYPDDIYSRQAVQYYGTGDRALDAKTMRLMQNYRGEADAPVMAYRAVPSSVPETAGINHGDWVTINPDYAKMHGESVLEGDYRILQKQVPARKLFTNGDSIHEFGYDETGKARLAALLASGALGAGGMYGLGLLSDR